MPVTTTSAIEEAPAAYLADLARRQDRVRPHDQPRYPLGEVALGDHLRAWARRAPTRVAIAYYGRELTFAELDDASDRLAGWLERAGVAVGDRVAVLLPTCPQFAVAFHAILKLGAVHVPVNPMFRELELAHELQDSQATVLIALDTIAERVAAIRGRTEVREVLWTSLADELPDEPTLPLPDELAAAPPPGAPASGWHAALAGPPIAQRPVDLDALAALNYTGGTMGLPKGCRHTQRHMLYTAVTSAAAWRFGEDFGGATDDAQVCFFAAFWIAGEDLALLLPVVTGTTCALLARWDPGAALAAIERYRATLMVGTVDTYLHMLDLPDRDRHDASSLRVPLAASFVRKLDVAVRRAWQAYAGEHSVMRECAFGMTETHTMDTSTAGFQEDDADLRARPVFCGVPMPGTEFKVVDPETKALLPLGAEGELAIRSPSVFDGYWRAPKATEEVLRDGWLHTGDIGLIDDDGCVHYLGRDKELIKVNGMSVFPAELEALLGMHPSVRAVGVVPREDASRGQRPVAFVELLDAPACDAEGLAAWAREHMAAYKVPEVRVVNALPRTDTGKIKKVELLGRV